MTHGHKDKDSGRHRVSKWQAQLRHGDATLAPPRQTVPVPLADSHPVGAAVREDPESEPSSTRDGDGALPDGVGAIGHPPRIPPLGPRASPCRIPEHILDAGDVRLWEVFRRGVRGSLALVEIT